MPEKLDAVASVSEDHKAYILNRHGTLNLEPLPSDSDRDPLNWPEGKKWYTLILVAFHCLSATFSSGGLTPTFQSMAEEYGKSLPTISYLVTTQILFLGISPLFWLPLMETYGRRPILLVSAIGSCAFNIGGGFCKTYGAQMATRILMAFFNCPPLVAAAAMVSEMYFAHQRGIRNGIWNAMFTIGTPGGPFLMGFVQQHAGTRWVLWTFAFFDFGLIIGWLFADETLYSPDRETRWRGLLPKKNPGIPHWDLIGVFKRGFDIRVLFSSIALALCFAYANVAFIVEMPQAVGLKFNLDAQSTGLQYISLIIGTAIGEALAGPVSDWWMNRSIKKRNGKKIPEDRLTTTYPGFIAIIVGLIIWGVKLQQAKPGKWTVSPLIGCAFGAAGNQITNTIIITYCIDLDYTLAVNTGLFVNMIRLGWCFISAFYFPKMFQNLGFGGAGGLMAGLVGVLGMAPMLIIQLTRTRKAEREGAGQVAEVERTGDSVSA